MDTRELEPALAAANPVDRDRLARIDLEAMETELLADLDGERPSPADFVADAPRRRPRRAALALGTAALAAAVLTVVLMTGGNPEHPSRAYGAELVRFAESTPLLLLDGPGWRVQNVTQDDAEGGYGMMEFVTGKPVPYESVRVTGTPERQRGAGMLPPSVRQRKVELNWRRGSLAEAVSTARSMPHPHGRRWSELPVLDTTAQVDERAEFYVNQGGPGDRQMTAFWSEGGYLLELRAAVPDLAAFEERLGWLTRVDSQTWLDAMPAKVVKAADRDAAVREMLAGVPLPDTFHFSRIPDTGLTTSREQVAGAAVATVACLWFRQWGTARRSGDKRSEAEAEQAMAGSRQWPILREMSEGGASTPLVWQLADGMPSGKGRRGWRLLPQAEALGCARQGIPVLPWKQRRQNERDSR
jgi:hypothetical protein